MSATSRKGVGRSPLALALLGGALLAVPVLAGACTDAGLFASDAKGPSAPDRATFDGTVCVPPATGDAFPVKVLFAVQGGAGVEPQVVGSVVQSLADVTGRFAVPYIQFALVGFHTVATGLQGGFVGANAVQPAIIRYGSYQEEGPVSLRAPILLARSILSGDMQTQCRGSVSRARYVVVLLITSGDTSCNNEAFNFDLNNRCKLLLPDSPACSQCELTDVTTKLKLLEDEYRAGEVTVQPIYIRETADPDVAAEVAAIAKAGGTAAIQTTPADLGKTLNALNYTSLQRQLGIKRMVAWNRNVVVRAGKQYVDSDGDGLSDEDEDELGLDALKEDTDGDGLKDGVERRMGMNPAIADTLTGCNPFLDSDGDRLNDCEERVLGTSTCEGDTDADGVPDLVEALSRTNPLVPEDLIDSDGDGTTNMAEIEAHTDPLSADNAFRADRGYGYQIHDAPPTDDGRACYQIRIGNVGVMATREIPGELFTTPAGNNDIYLYFEAGRQNDPRGAGVSALHTQSVRFTPPATRDPSGVITLTPDGFVLGI